MIKTKIFCFGELLLRLSPSLKGEWLRSSVMPFFLGGAELNVATALASWNIPVGYCTAMPVNYLSVEICSALKEKKIDTGSILFGGNRVGIYFLPQGADLKNAGVIYDRAGSSFSELHPGMIDWDQCLEGFSWFHFSAITPALNENLAALCREGLQAASRKKMTISVDLNYRSKLWQYGKKPEDIMPELLTYCDVIMGNIWACETLLGIPVDAEILQKGKKSDFLLHAWGTSRHIRLHYPRSKTVANTFRFDSSGSLLYYGTLISGDHQYVSPEFRADAIEDKVGSGDCFMAGLIYGISKDIGPQETINFASSAAFGKFQEKGDSTSQDPETVMGRMDGFRT